MSKYKNKVSNIRMEYLQLFYRWVLLGLRENHGRVHTTLLTEWLTALILGHRLLVQIWRAAPSVLAYCLLRRDTWVNIPQQGMLLGYVR